MTVASTWCWCLSWWSNVVDVMSVGHVEELRRRQSCTPLRYVLDRLVPQRTVTCRRHLWDPWFDQECRDAKRRVRRLERASSRTNRAATADRVSAKVAEAAAAAAAWTTAHTETFYIRNVKPSGRRLFLWESHLAGPRYTYSVLNLCQWSNAKITTHRVHFPLSYLGMHIGSKILWSGLSTCVPAKTATPEVTGLNRLIT